MQFICVYDVDVALVSQGTETGVLGWIDDDINCVYMYRRWSSSFLCDLFVCVSMSVYMYMCGWLLLIHMRVSWTPVRLLYQSWDTVSAWLVFSKEDENGCISVCRYDSAHHRSKATQQRSLIPYVWILYAFFMVWMILCIFRDETVKWMHRYMNWFKKYISGWCLSHGITSDSRAIRIVFKEYCKI